ncbi:MAG: hypothetical protein AAF892_14305 [Cyanobacteria bacterium P01_D01_bin.71]
MTWNALFLSQAILSVCATITIAFVGLLLAHAPGFSADGMAADISSISGPAFLRWGETALFRISTGLAIALGASIAAFTWFHPGPVVRVLASLASGIGVYFAATVFLGSVPYTTTAAYGITPENWNALVLLLPLIPGIMVAIANVWWLKRESSLLSRILASLLTCISTLSLCSLTWSFVLLFSLDTLNFATPLLTAIAIALPIAAAILAAVWAGFPTRRSLQRLLTLNNGIVAIGLTLYGLVYLLLLLGYAD